MMLPLDVPFVHEGNYPEFLAERAEALGCVHFSLHDPAVADARQLLESRDTAALLDALSTLKDVPKYVLMNTRLHAPDRYFDTERLAATASRLTELVERNVATGIIFADPYYLQALSDAHPALAGKLEAVPSVNAMLDSPGRVFSMLDMIETTAFRPPSRLVLDRALNRDMDRLSHCSKLLRAARPGISLYLIANEGCLFQCPYKAAHDAHIALVNERLCSERTFAMNREFGCIRRLLNEPARFLTSPFIRPEDVREYTAHIDGIKLCGRNRGVPFLSRAVTAYLEEYYTGNLLDLMDAMGDLADRVVIPNQDIPHDFVRRVGKCDKDCRTCGWCASLAETHVSRIDPGIA